MGKFFNTRVKNEENNNKLKFIFIGVGALMVIILVIVLIITTAGKKPKLKEDGISIGIGEEYPDARDFFKKIDDDTSVKADYSKCDNTKVGDCKVKISGDYSTTAILHIKDFTPPEVTIKEKVQIEVGASYKPEDFIESCTDNIDETCIIKFYEGAKDDDGNKIDYSSYVDEGTYTIKFYATDSSDNKSDFFESTLIIGNASNCEYGDNTYDTEKYSYPLSVDVSVNNCALKKELYSDASTQEKANQLYNTDYENLKNDMNDILKTEYPNGANITVCPSYVPVFNKSGKGLVGYSIYIKVLISDTKKIECSETGTEEYKVLSYYIQKDGTRLYEENKYNV